MTTKRRKEAALEDWDAVAHSVTSLTKRKIGGNCSGPVAERSTTWENAARNVGNSD